jgi:hypothetical protein
VPHPFAFLLAKGWDTTNFNRGFVHPYWSNSSCTMELSLLKSNSEHEAALLEIESLWDAKEGTTDGDRLDILMTMVEAYEEKHFPMG